MPDQTRMMLCDACGLRYEELDHQIPGTNHGRCPRCTARGRQMDETRGVFAGRSDPAYTTMVPVKTE